MSYAQANQKYTESAVLSATPEQQVVLLYDGAIRFLKQSSTAMEMGNREISRNRLMRAEAIINELNLTLDMGQPVAAQLRSLYLFCKRHLAEALIEQDAAKIDEVRELLGDLRASWAEAVQQVTATAAVQA